MKATVNSRCDICDGPIVKDDDEVVKDEDSWIHEACRDRIALDYDREEVCDKCWLVHTGECF